MGLRVRTVTGEPDEQHDTTLICIHCMLDEHPELGQGMDIAKAHGEAIRDRNTWVSR